VTTDNSVFAAGTQPSFRHVGSVYDSSAQTVVLYNNSSVESSTPTDTIPASIYDTFASFVIGASNVEASQWHLTGSIASVMIFSRALSAAEIANIYNRDKGRF